MARAEQRRLGSRPPDPSRRPAGAGERAGRAKFPTPALELRKHEGLGRADVGMNHPVALWCGDRRGLWGPPGWKGRRPFGLTVPGRVWLVRAPCADATRELAKVRRCLKITSLAPPSFWQRVVLHPGKWGHTRGVPGARRQPHHAHRGPADDPPHSR